MKIADDTTRPVVLVWRACLLPGSETFIRDQVAGLRTWRPQLAGATRVDSPLSATTDTVHYTRRLWDRAALWIAARTGHAPRLTRALRRSGARVVHAHFLPDAWLVRRAARAAEIPLVVTCHGYDVTAWPAAPGWRGRIRRWQARRVLVDAALVIAVSRFIADRARACGAAAPVVVRTGVRLRELPERAPEVDVVFVGRLVPKKGVADLLAALPEVERRTGRMPRTLIVGDGPLRDELEAAAPPGVRFAGVEPPSGVAAALASARVFVGPSRTAPDGDAEGLGQVFLEAALAGLPVVAYRSGGVPEAVVDGVTGLLAEEGDVAGLAARITTLLTDPQLATRLGAQGRRRVEREFSLEQGCRELERLYARAATGTPPG